MYWIVTGALSPHCGGVAVESSPSTTDSRPFSAAPGRAEVKVLKPCSQHGCRFDRFKTPRQDLLRFLLGFDPTIRKTARNRINRGFRERRGVSICYLP
jgi:hypothetical protein